MELKKEPRKQGFQTVDEYREWQKDRIEQAALLIGKALNALPREYGDPHQNNDVGGNLHNALGQLLGMKIGLGAEKDKKIIERIANKHKTE